MNKKLLTLSFSMVLAAVAALPQASAQDYDLLLKGGHVIDAKNNIDAVRDVAIKRRQDRQSGRQHPAKSAIKTVNMTGLYVTPGLIDIHTHDFWGLTKNSYNSGDWGLPPDRFTLRNGITTIVDAGSSGWRNFPVFKSESSTSPKPVCSPC